MFSGWSGCKLSFMSNPTKSLNGFVARSLSNLANLCGEQGKYEEAEQLSQRALAIREQIYGPLHPATIETQKRLFHVLQTMGADEKAVQPHKGPSEESKPTEPE